MDSEYSYLCELPETHTSSSLNSDNIDDDMIEHYLSLL